MPRDTELRVASSPRRARRNGSRRARTALAVDIGGTFTDVVLAVGEKCFTGKVLTTPQAPDEGVLQAIHEILGASGVAPSTIELFILGTTLATNALI